MLVAATALAGLAAPAGADGGYQQVVDITFPTQHEEVTYEDWYHEDRSGGRKHKATDLMGRQMVELYAAVSGEICRAPRPEPDYGYRVTICGDDGRKYTYLHLNNDTPGTDDGAGGPQNAYAPGIKEGARVERGEMIGWMGDSGNADPIDAHHLHFEIKDTSVTDPYGSHRINPFYSLKQAEKEGDYAPRDGGQQEPTAEQTEQETPAEPLEFPDACPEGEVPDAGYSDVSQDMFHALSIDCVSWWDVAVPAGADSYRPDDAVTRGEMAGFAAALMAESGRSLPDEPADAYPDDEDSPYEEQINQLAETEIVDGYTDGTFRPGGTLTRGQMAKFLVRAAEYETSDLEAGEDHFPDDDGTEHEQWINTAASAGFVQGYQNGDYAPGDDIQRKQTATFLAGILEHLVDEGHAAPPDGS